MSKIKNIPWDGITPALYSHLKIDGNFLKVKRLDNGELQCLSSIDTDLTYKISKCRPAWFLNLHKNMPLNSCVLGELYYYDVENRIGLPASYISTGLANSENYFNSDDKYGGLLTLNEIDKRRLGNKRKKEEIISGKRQLCFAAFAIEYGFSNISEASFLEDVQVKCLALGVEFAPFMSFAYSKKKFPTKNELLQDLPLWQSGFKGLAEGFVLKNSNLLGWRKVKKENTIDCFIIGYIPGKGKYSGKVGSLRVAVYTSGGVEIEIASVGGFNDEIRDYITEWKEDMIGEVIEVQYQFVASQGKLRHPRWKGWREDKFKEDCTTEQDFELVKHWG